MVKYLTKQVNNTGIQDASIEDLENLFLKNDRIGFDAEFSDFRPWEEKLILLQFGTYEQQIVIHSSMLNEVFSNPIIMKRLHEVTLCGSNIKVDIKFLIHRGITNIKVEDAMINQICLYNGLFDTTESDDDKNEAQNIDGLYSLAGMCLYYLGVVLDKNIRQDFITFSETTPIRESHVLYAADDVKWIIPLIEEQKKHPHYPYCKNVIALENKFIYPLAQIEYNGIEVDLHKWQEVKAATDIALKEQEGKVTEEVLNLGEAYPEFMEFLTTDRSKYKEPVKRAPSKKFVKPTYRTNTRVTKKQEIYIVKYTTIGGEEKIHSNINWASHQQKLEIIKFLCDLKHIDLPTKKVRNQKTKIDEVKPTVDKNALIELKEDLPLANLLINWSVLEAIETKFTSTLPKFIDDTTGKIHTQFKQIVSTGRMSSKSPNLQQIPSKTHQELAKAIRKSFVSNGEMLVTADYSNIELRIIAHLSQDPTWLNAFNNNQDLHSLVAATLFNADIENVRTERFNGVPLRDIAKSINFGLAYGMSSIKLSSILKVTVEEAQLVIDKYFEKLPKVQEFLDKLEKYTKNYFVSFTAPPFTRPRFYDRAAVVNLQRVKGVIQECLDDSSIAKKLYSKYGRQGKNHPIQGCNADIVKLACIYIQHFIDTNEEFSDCKIRLIVHDEIVSSCPPELAEVWREKKTELMIKAAKVVITSVPVLVDAHIAPYWTK